MKKLFKMLAVAAMVCAGVMMTSCTEEDLAAITGPNDTWCTIPIEKDNSVIGYASIIYSENGYTSTSTADGYLKNGTKIESGITVAVWLANASATSDSVSGTVLAGLAGSQYAIKNFPKSGSTITDGSSDTDGYSFAGTKEKFSAVYLAKSEMRKSENQKKLPQSPTALSNGGRTKIDLENFNWKTLLKSYLIDSVL